MTKLYDYRNLEFRSCAFSNNQDYSYKIQDGKNELIVVRKPFREEDVEVMFVRVAISSGNNGKRALPVKKSKSKTFYQN